jgi:NAD(P)-dependent dehydrogenase (short-subunit alcohol dehydrogenase family)
MPFLGKVAIVTDAGSGIGRTTAVLFSQRGIKVVLVGRRLSPLNETLSQLSEESLAVQADVRKLSDARRIVDEALQEFGRLDILVNNAGVEGPGKTVPELSEDDWDMVLDINLKGAFLCSKFAIPAMIRTKGGVITNVASN